MMAEGEKHHQLPSDNCEDDKDGMQVVPGRTGSCRRRRLDTQTIAVGPALDVLTQTVLIGNRGICRSRLLGYNAERDKPLLDSCAAEVRANP